MENFQNQEGRLDPKRYFFLGSTDYELLSELLFTLLPFVAALLVHAHKGNVGSIFSKSEWAMASAVLSGQAIVKFVVAFVDNVSEGNRLSRGALALIVAAMIVFLLSTSLICLALIEVSSGESKAVPVWLIALQIALFFISAFSFFILGGIKKSLAQRIR